MPGRAVRHLLPVVDPKSGQPVYLNPGLTMGENIGDNGGVRVVYMALASRLAHGPLAGRWRATRPNSGSSSGSRRVSCQNMTVPELLNRVTYDPHSANRFRTNGPLRTVPEFQKAFSCPTGSFMAPAARCRVW